MALSHGDAATPEQGDLQNLHVHIDDALDGLAEEDRQAIVLRYYGSKSFVEIGQMFGLSDDGARKRVDRALDKLRTVMLRKGVTSTAVALSAALTVNAATTAPVALGASVAGTAVASATAAGVGAMLATYKAAVFGLGTVAVGAIGSVIYQAKQVSELQRDLAGASTVVAALRAELDVTKQAAQRLERHLQQAEDDASLLIGAVRQANIMPTNESHSLDGPPNQSMVEKRYAEARAHAQAGRHAEALEGFLWCFDTGMPAVPRYAGVRLSFLVREIQKLAAVYAPAMTALRERRDRSEEGMLGKSGETTYALEFAALNDALGEEQRTIDAFFRFNEGDPRRSAMASRVLRMLARQRRYNEAASVQTLDGLLLEFERNTRAFDRSSLDEKTSEAARRATLDKFVTSVEVLAGANRPAEARIMIATILAWDRSDQSVRTLREAVRRSGSSDSFDLP